MKAIDFPYFLSWKCPLRILNSSDFSFIVTSYNKAIRPTFR